MSAPVENVTAQMANTTLAESKPQEDSSKQAAPAETSQQNNANDEAVLASAAEGRRLYIGNLAYATTEGELKGFFEGYLVYVLPVIALTASS